MANPAVVNASPLIYLARADLFDLLRLAGDPVLVPDPVATEILARGADDSTARRIATTAWIEQVVGLPPPPEILAWDLGVGESSVLAWALAHPGCRAVVDDLHGRRCAEALGIPLRGTVGLVLRARRAGQLVSARAALETLRAAGMYLSQQILDAAVAEIGE